MTRKGQPQGKYLIVWMSLLNLSFQPIENRLPGQFLNQTVEEALKSGNTTIRKLLTDGRFVK